MGIYKLSYKCIVVVVMGYMVAYLGLCNKFIRQGYDISFYMNIYKLYE